MAIRNISDNDQPTYDLREILRKKRESVQGLEQIRVDQFNIDHSYQRPVSPTMVNRIVKEFDSRLFGIVTVSRRADGSYWVLDGQHRIAALIKMGKGNIAVPCEVLTGLSMEDEARVFHLRNANKKTMTPQEKFRGALAAGDERAIRIDRAVRAAGFQINLDSSELHGGLIPATASLERVDRQYRDGHLETTLGLIRTTWGTENGPRGNLITGLAYLLYLYRDTINIKRFVEKLSDLTLEHVYSMSKKYRESTKVGTDIAVCAVLIDRYNHKLHHKNQLLDPITMAALNRAKELAGGN